MAEDPPPDPLFDDVDRWQLEENHVAQADRLALVIVAVLACMIFLVLLMLVKNSG